MVDLFFWRLIDIFKTKYRLQWSGYLACIEKSDSSLPIRARFVKIDKKRSQRRNSTQQSTNTKFKRSSCNSQFLMLMQQKLWKHKVSIIFVSNFFQDNKACMEFITRFLCSSFWAEIVSMGLKTGTQILNDLQNVPFFAICFDAHCSFRKYWNKSSQNTAKKCRSKFRTSWKRVEL